MSKCTNCGNELSGLAGLRCPVCKFDNPAQVMRVALDVCAGCGYDLQGLEGLRCPECGLDNDPEKLRAAAVDWFLSRRGVFGRRMPPFGAQLLDSEECSRAAWRRFFGWTVVPWLGVIGCAVVANAMMQDWESPFIKWVLLLGFFGWIALSSRLASWSTLIMTNPMAFAELSEQSRTRSLGNAMAILGPAQLPGVVALAAAILFSAAADNRQDYLLGISSLACGLGAIPLFAVGSIGVCSRLQSAGAATERGKSILPIVVAWVTHFLLVALLIGLCVLGVVALVYFGMKAMGLNLR